MKTKSLIMVLIVLSLVLPISTHALFDTEIFIKRTNSSLSDFFVPYLGANMSVDLGSYNLTAYTVNTTVLCLNGDCRSSFGSSGIGSLIFKSIHGFDLSGYSGETNRQYLISSLNLVEVDNYLLHPSVDYDYTANILTFYNNVWDDQNIALYYTTGNYTITSVNHYGSDFSGSDGSTNRALAFANAPVIVAVDNYVLHSSIDFTYNGVNIIFINNLWNDQVVTVWY